MYKRQAICEQVKHLADHFSDFMKQLEKARSAHAGNRSEFETKLSTLRKEQAETCLLYTSRCV